MPFQNKNGEKFSKKIAFQKKKKKKKISCFRSETPVSSRWREEGSSFYNLNGRRDVVNIGGPGRRKNRDRHGAGAEPHSTFNKSSRGILRQLRVVRRHIAQSLKSLLSADRVAQFPPQRVESSF